MSDPTLFDTDSDDDAWTCGVPVHADATRAELAAANRIAATAPLLRTQALRMIRDSGDRGVTNRELGNWYAAVRGKDPDDGSCRYSMAPRCTELQEGAFIVDSGRQRDGFIVWVATAKPGDGRLWRRPRPKPAEVTQ
ncbi:MAG: hypothetical protein JWO31_4290 [Phycisphaerales bacterium]|nr:hypothetical protein [Phycisphaerales bacterium]